MLVFFEPPGHPVSRRGYPKVPSFLYPTGTIVVKKNRFFRALILTSENGQRWYEISKKEAINVYESVYGRLPDKLSL